MVFDVLCKWSTSIPVHLSANSLSPYQICGKFHNATLSVEKDVVTFSHPPNLCICKCDIKQMKLQYPSSKEKSICCLRFTRQSIIFVVTVTLIAGKNVCSITVFLKKKKFIRHMELNEFCHDV